MIPARFAIFRGCIVTANADGSIPLNAKFILMIPEDHADELLEELVDRANKHAELQEKK